MEAKQIKKILEDAWNLGCLFVTVTGGEPLLREDLPEILGYAKNIGLSTILLTNGYLLPDKVSKIRRRLDVVSVSVDFPDTRQDRMRHLEGLLERIKVGVKLARDYGIATNMNSIITGMHTLKDIGKLLVLAESLNSSISFSPMAVMPESCETGFIGRLTKEGEEMIIKDWNTVRKIADKLLYYEKR